MGNQCADESCDVELKGSCSDSAQGCPCGTSGCSGDPLDCAQGMWAGSFFTALKEAQVELLKDKIKKAWGPKMDKAADAALEAMGAQWQSMLAQAQATAGFREKLAGLWREGK